MWHDMLWQGKIQKHITRKALDTPDDACVPAVAHPVPPEGAIQCRGVGYDWLDELRAKAADEMRIAMSLFVLCCWPSF